MIVQTSKFNIHITKSFYNDFEVICLKLKEQYSDDYINRIELLANEQSCAIESIYINNEVVKSYNIKKRCLWILVKKEQNLKEHLLSSLDKFENAYPLYPKNAEIMLLLSSLPRFKVDDVININGSIYQLVNQKRTKKQLVFLNYKIFNGVISQHVRTFTLYKIAKYNINKKYAYSTSYVFKNSVLEVSSELKDEHYVIGNKTSRKIIRNSIEFFKIPTSLVDFSHTRIYYFYKLLKDVNVHLSKYISIDYANNNYINIPIMNVHEDRSNLILQQSYNLLNHSMNREDDLLDKLELCLRRAYPKISLNIEKSNIINKDKINVIIVNTKEEYELASICDKHIRTPDFVTQHIYLSEVEKAYQQIKNGKNDCMVGKVILIDALIKKEIIERKMKIYQFRNDYFSNKIFVVPTGLKKNDHVRLYVEMRINNNELIFSKHEKKTEYPKYNFNHIGYIISENKVSVISNSEEIILPNIDFVVKKCSKVDDFGRTSKEDIIKAMNNFSIIVRLEHNDNVVSYWESSISKVYDKMNEYYHNELTSSEIRSILNPLKEIKVFKLYGEFIKYFDKEYNKLIAPLLSSVEQKEKYLVGFEGINYCLNKDDLFYSVGYSKLRDIKPNISKAIRVKTVSFADSELISNYFDLLDVSFIRYKQATVVPFPFKFIREFIKMQPDLEVKDQDEDMDEDMNDELM